MSGTRRAILLTGGAAVLIAGGWALTRAPKKARAPWSAAGESFGDPRLDALAYAILAPNPHNMQPWRVLLEGDDAISVYCNLERLLPETDPPNRQITVGFGCFLELYAMAMAEKGARVEIDPFPGGEPYPLLDERPVARVRAVPGASVVRDPLFAHALARRTNRAPFDDRVPDAQTLAAITGSAPDISAMASSDPPLIEALRALTIEAWRTEWTLDRTRRESIEVTPIGKRENNEKPWGLSLAGPVMEAAGAAGVLTHEHMDEPDSTAFAQSLEFYEKACRTAAAYVWSTTITNTRRDQIAAGRAWVRMQLAANAAGVAFHPLSQSLQEFPEMRPHYDKAHALLAPEGGTVQMLARLGYAIAPPPAPREPLQSKLIGA